MMTTMSTDFPTSASDESLVAHSLEVGSHVPWPPCGKDQVLLCQPVVPVARWALNEHRPNAYLELQPR